jgi:hypothetical protein
MKLEFFSVNPTEDKREAGKRNQAKWDKCRAAIIQDGGVSSTTSIDSVVGKGLIDQPVNSKYKEETVPMSHNCFRCLIPDGLLRTQRSSALSSTPILNITQYCTQNTVRKLQINIL